MDPLLILKFAGRYWWALALAGAGVVIGFQHVHVLELQKGAATLKAANVNLQAKVTEQNSAVDLLQSKQQALVKQVQAQQAELAAQASTVRVIYRDRIKLIKAQPVPQQCASAAQWGAQQVRNLLRSAP